MNRGSLFLALSLLSLGGCASIPQGVEHDPRDRFERFNRGVYKFNDALDRSVARPLAVVYATVTPRPVRSGVTNFFANLSTPVTMVNELLQAKFVGFGTDTARLVVNTTIGIGGLFDPATKMGLQKGDEDFGQTLGKWGLPAGPYLMLPVLGPATVRDGVGRVADQFTEPRNYIGNKTVRLGLTGLELVDKRAQLLEADAVLRRSYDPYGFVRSAYLQRREFQVYDGNPPDEEPEDFSDDDDDAG
ncbi:MAG: VacJ family lipoprotein [Steroidobacteraceae bacterium]